MKLLPHALLDELAARAASSPRARAHYNIHATPADLVQRFLVVARADSYFRPHRHASRSELAVVLRGRLDVLVFDARGRVSARYGVGEGTDTMAYESPQNVWHTVVPGAAGGPFLAIKEGPDERASSTYFNDWATTESDAAVPEFSAWLRRAQPGDTPP